MENKSKIIGNVSVRASDLFKTIIYNIISKIKSICYWKYLRRIIDDCDGWWVILRLGYESYAVLSWRLSELVCDRSRSRLTRSIVSAFNSKIVGLSWKINILLKVYSPRKYHFIPIITFVILIVGSEHNFYPIQISLKKIISYTIQSNRCTTLQKKQMLKSSTYPVIYWITWSPYHIRLGEWEFVCVIFICILTWSNCSSLSRMTNYGYGRNIIWSNN